MPSVRSCSRVHGVSFVVSVLRSPFYTSPYFRAPTTDPNVNFLKIVTKRGAVKHKRQSGPPFAEKLYVFVLFELATTMAEVSMANMS
jgi:hypothetical protein